MLDWATNSTFLPGFLIFLAALLGATGVFLNSLRISRSETAAAENTQTQLALLQEPSIRVLPEKSISKNEDGLRGIFDLSIANEGLSDVRNVEVYEDYFVFNVQDGRPSLTRFGLVSTMSDTQILSLEKNQSIEFQVDFSDVLPQMTKFRVESKGPTSSWLRLKITYVRKADGRRYSFYKVYTVGGEGEALLDIDMRGYVFPPQAGPSFDEIKRMLTID